MRILSALLCFVFTLNVFAASGTTQELERALDDYHYALTVEWDQKDKVFQTQATEAFYGTLSTLMAKGLTPADVMALVEKKSKNKEEVAAIKLKMELLASNAVSTEDLARAMTDHSKDMYSTGASWEGAVIISVGIGVLLAAAIAYSIWWDSKHVCVATAQGQQCGWVSYYQGGPQYYQCWETTYCTQYEEK